MSKAQKGNKENKKPKADKNQKNSCIGLQNGAGSGQTILQSVCEKNLRPDARSSALGRARRAVIATATNLSAQT